MKICYLVMVHHKFDQALRLVRRLATPDTGFVFHIDSGADAAAATAFRAALKPLESVVFARSVRSRWGSYRQALAIMRCVETAMDDPVAYDRYVLLSGQDYPIASQFEILRFFREHHDREFLEAFPLDVLDAAAEGWSPYFRFRRYHLWIGRKHLQVPVLRKGPPPAPIHHGSTWWALTREALEYIADQFTANARLRRYLRTGFLVDEAYIPTLLMNSRFAGRITGNNVTHAQWTPTSGPHPKTLRSDDFDALVTSPKLFARKFDAATDVDLLDRLDAWCDGKLQRTDMRIPALSPDVRAAANSAAASAEPRFETQPLAV